MSGSGGAPEPPRTVRADAPDALELAATVITSGGLVALPTETVYGIACALSAHALERLIQVKGRDVAKGIALLVESLEQAESFAHVTDRARRVARALWPGPLTLVVPLAAGARLPPLVTGGRDTVALRSPDHPFPRALAALTGPLPLTSANRSGEPEARDADEVKAALGGAVSLLLDGGRVPIGVPSTVIAVTRDDQLHLLREGALSAREIAARLS